MRKQYLKFYPSDWLEDGICSVLSPAQRGVYLQLWALAGISREEGTIHIRPGQPFDLHHLARRLRIKQELLKDTLTRCSQYGMLSEDEDGIQITGWKLDQAPPITPKPRQHQSATSTTNTSQSSKESPPSKRLTPAEIAKMAEEHRDDPEKDLWNLPISVQEAVKAMAKKMAMPGAESTPRKKLTDEEICQKLGWTQEQLNHKRAIGSRGEEGVEF